MGPRRHASEAGRARRWLLLGSLCAALLVAASDPAPGRAAGDPPPISHLRYAAIMKTLEASLPLDSGVERQWIDAYRASCRQLSTRDPLLRAYRPVCLNWESTYQSALIYNDRCPYLSLETKDPLKGIDLVDRCQGEQNLYNASLQLRLIPASEKLDRALNRYVRTKACREALYASARLLRFYRQVGAADRLMGRGQITSSSKDTEAASNELIRIGNSYPQYPTNHDQLTEFRKGCR